ncbi:MAG: sensor domain-containing diguanylate cyclase [Candidatus Brocadiaceae bacterium]|nr:sensor domain-containing diguanylate cyclase [Candidatus Brocadiaceae bacterium]
MIKISPTVRISLGLVFISLSVLIFGNFTKLIPNRSAVVMEKRRYAAEALAVQFTMSSQKKDVVVIKKALDITKDMYPEVLSLGLRGAKGYLIAQTQDHKIHWVAPPGEESTATHWQIPIFQGKRLHSTLEISFTPVNEFIVLGYNISPFIILIASFACVTFVGFFIFMRRVIRNLDPTLVMPSRVKYVFDTLTEGVLLIDKKERVVLANQALADKLGCSINSLMGSKASGLDWRNLESNKTSDELPWLKAMRDGENVSSVQLKFATKSDGFCTFSINVALINENNGKSRGALVTFTDLTELEKKNSQLSTMVEQQQLANAEIERQNRDLEILSTRDPLTDCLNRRAFYAKAEKCLTKAAAEQSTVSCVMTDIDKFKAVNDTYGHGVGDEVIKYLANTLRTSTRTDDIVCRFGGEEFCVLLPDCSVEEAASIFEQIRIKIEAHSARAISGAPGINITSSFGVSELNSSTNNVDDMIHQADTALYKAKDSGRNCIVVWNESLDHEGENAVQEVSSVG